MTAAASANPTASAAATPITPGSPDSTYLRRRWREIRMVANGYLDDRVPRMAAALSYYTVFSLAPVLVIAVAVAGLIFGDEAARTQITEQFRGLIGKEGGEAAQIMIMNAPHGGSNLFAVGIGVATLLVGATGVFGELQDSLNTIWKVRTRPGRTLHSLIRARLLSFTMVFGVCFLLLVSLMLSAGLTAVGTWLHGPQDAWRTFAQVSDVLISCIVICVLFAGSFKLLPDVTVRWRDVWSGALLASLLFVLGKFLIGLYLGKSEIGSTYGSMGALAVLLVWIYFSSQVFLIGALFTHARAVLSGAQMVPRGDAEWIPGNDPPVVTPAARAGETDQRPAGGAS